MLSKSDKQFLITNFATKADLKNFATKEDISILAKQKDLVEIKQDIKDLTGAVGAIFEWMDDIHRAIVGKPIKSISGN